MKLIASNRNYFPALTGLRALAATMIFLHHYLAHHPLVPRHVNYLITKFPTGLLLFFVLTGFLITYRYLGTGNLSAFFLRRYFQNRVVRIFPIYLTLTTITLLLAGVRDWREWLVNLTLTKSLFNDYKFSGIPQAWSLTVDEVFYALAPLLQLFFRKGVRVWMLLLGCLATGLALVGLSQLLGLGSFFGTVKFMFRYTFFGYSFAFLLGMWLAQQYRSHPETQQRPGALLTTLGFGSLAVALYGWSVLAEQVDFFKSNQAGGVFIYNGVIVAISGLCVIGLVKETTWVSRVLSSKLLVKLGMASYAFYLLHLGFFASFLSERFTHHPAFIFGICWVAAFVLHHFFEQPLVDRFGGSRILRQLDLPTKA